MFVKFAEHRHGFDFDDAASKVSVMQSKDGERVRVISGASVTSARLADVLTRIGDGVLLPAESRPVEESTALKIFVQSLVGNFRFDCVAVMNEALGVEEFDIPPTAEITESNPIADSEVSELFYATDRFAMDELDRVKMRS